MITVLNISKYSTCARKCYFGGVFLLFFVAELSAQSISNLRVSYQKATSDGARIPLLQRIAELYLESDIDSAKFFAEKAYKIRRQARTKRDEARSILMLGYVLMKTQTSARNVRPYFEEALKIAERTQDKVLLGEVYTRLGEFAAYRENVQDAIAHLKKAIAIFKETNEPRLLRNAYHQLGNAYMKLGAPKEAIDMFLKCFELFGKDERINTAGILSDIGNVYYGQGNFIDALNYYQQALQRSKEYQDVYAQGYCLNNIGLVYNKLGNHQDALEYHLQALQCRLKSKSIAGVSNSYQNIGRAYIFLGYIEKGKQYIYKALDLDRKTNNRQSWAQGIDYVGAILCDNKKYTEALKLFEEALSIRRETRQSLPIARSYENIGQVYRLQKHFSDALGYFLMADSIYKRAEANDYATGNRIQLAKVYLELGKFAESKEYAEKALNLAKARRMKGEIFDASQVLAQVYDKQGDYRLAYAYQAQALAYKDSLYAEEKNERVLRMQALFEFKQSESLIKTKEKENEKLKSDKHYMLQLQYITVSFFTVLLVLLGVILYFMWRNRQLDALKKQELAESNAEIIQKSVEIEIQKQAIEEQNKELHKAHEDLRETNQELIDSIAYAYRIQRAVLPTAEELTHALPSHFILYKPRNVVSGDFYWFSEKETQTILAVMDCTGHGIPGAFMSLIGNDLLHEIVNVREIHEPACILTELKKRVNTVLKQHTTQGRDGMDIGVCVIDHEQKDTPRFLYFAAAHLSLVYFEGKKLYELEGSKIYIGGYDPDDTERNFETRVLPLQHVSALYMFSDGYQDQFAENSKKKFTKKRLRKILRELHLLNPQLQSEILEETIEEWRGQNEQTDDIIICGVFFQKSLYIP